VSQIKTLLAALACGFSPMAAATPALATACSFAAQGEGRVAAVIDARSFRLTDGRDIRLAGIEPVAHDAANRSAALSALVSGRDVALRGEDDTPDRYGRQPAFVFLDGTENSVQATLVGQGEALVSAHVADRNCAAALLAAEAGARDAKRGIWAGPAVIKNAESPGDILAGNGRFMLVEGRCCRYDRPGQPLI
jgi:endonuclease YncB( thermonuclease family)